MPASVGTSLAVIQIVQERLVQNLVSAGRGIVASEIPVADGSIRVRSRLSNCRSGRRLPIVECRTDQAFPQIIDCLVNDFDFRFHAGRREEPRDLVAMLLVREAVIQRGKRVQLAIAFASWRLGGLELWRCF